MFSPEIPQAGPATIINIHAKPAAFENMFDIRLNVRLFSTGISGTIKINVNGDRDSDFTITDLDPVSGEWQVRLVGWLWTKHHILLGPRCYVFHQ